jgi:hypothetical protein
VIFFEPLSEITARNTLYHKFSPELDKWLSIDVGPPNGEVRVACPFASDTPTPLCEWRCAL